MPVIVEDGDAIIKLAAACVCGSDLWAYRGIDPITTPISVGHEYCGVVQEVGPSVTNVKPGDFVVGSFFASDNTCEICRSGYQSGCLDRRPMGAQNCQAEYLRVPLADGTLVATPTTPDPDLIPSLLACSDVLGTGWFAAKAAEVGPGKTVAVIGDGAVGLLAVLSAKLLGADRIIAMSRHEPRQKLALEFGATDIVSARGEEGVAEIKELTDGLGVHSALEAVGSQESMMQAIRATRRGGHVGFVGVSHDVNLPGLELFFSQVHLHGGPAPVCDYLPDLIERIMKREINPGRVFDLELNRSGFHRDSAVLIPMSSGSVCCARSSPARIRPVEVAEVAVQAAAVVPEDPVQGRQFDVLEGLAGVLAGGAGDQFGFVVAVHGLCQGVDAPIAGDIRHRTAVVEDDTTSKRRDAP